MKKFFIVLQAMFHPSNQGIAGIVLMGVAVPAVIAFMAGVLWPLLISAVFAGVFVLMFKAASGDVDTYMQEVQAYSWRQWVESAPDEEEALSRRQAAESAGWAGLPPVNIDGVPMLEGSPVDIYGRIYGDNNDEHFNFDTFSSDAATGMPIDTYDAYSSPIGMDSHHHHH